MIRKAHAVWRGTGREGDGDLTTASGILSETPYSYRTRFENQPGTNPEELIAAAHAGCFTMALSFALAREGVSEGKLETKASVTIEQEDDGFRITRSDLELSTEVPNIEESRLRELAEDAKAHCPVSRLLNAEMELSVHIHAPAA